MLKRLAPVHHPCCLWSCSMTASLLHVIMCLHVQISWLQRIAAPEGSLRRQLLDWVGILDAQACLTLAALLSPKGWLLAATALKRASCR